MTHLNQLLLSLVSFQELQFRKAILGSSLSFNRILNIYVSINGDFFCIKRLT